MRKFNVGEEVAVFERATKKLTFVVVVATSESEEKAYCLSGSPIFHEWYSREEVEDCFSISREMANAVDAAWKSDNPINTLFENTMLNDASTEAQERLMRAYVLGYNVKPITEDLEVGRKVVIEWQTVITAELSITEKVIAVIKDSFDDGCYLMNFKDFYGTEFQKKISINDIVEVK